MESGELQVGELEIGANRNGQMYIRVGNRTFRLEYVADDAESYNFMKLMLKLAFEEHYQYRKNQIIDGVRNKGKG